MANATARESIPVTLQEQTLLEQARQDGPLRSALIALTGETGTSRAAVAHAILAVGMEAVRAQAQEVGYAALAAAYTSDELAERREDADSRRARGAQRWSGE